MKDNKRLFQLFGAHYKGLASKEEEAELMRLLEAETDEEISRLLQKTWAEEGGEGFAPNPNTRRRLLEKMAAVPDEETPVHPLPQTRKPFLLRMASAAAVLLALSFGLFFLLAKKEERLVAKAPPVAPLPTDAAPAGEKAVLTLADGSRLVLDSAANGNLVTQGQTKVVKTGGGLVYKSNANAAEVLYNTVTTPRGGQFRLVLSDGTRVWLNAASSLRFPTAFAGQERSVELSGEGYFEVVHNAGKPFRVKVNDVDVQVLGTHFNINSYADEPAAKTTLLEGRVLVRRKDKALYLHPGQQAVAAQTGAAQNSLTVDRVADVDAVMAWKNGLFIFNNSDLPKILRDFSRWYDVDVDIEGNLGNKEIFGLVNRNSSLSSVMKQLKTGSPVPFTYRMEGKRLMVQVVKH